MSDSVNVLARGRILGGKYTVRAALPTSFGVQRFDAITEPNREVIVDLLAPELAAIPEVLAAVTATRGRLVDVPEHLVVHMLDVGVDEETGAAYVVTPAPGAPALAELAQVCPLDAAELVALARALAQSLGAAHAKGVAHLALDPGRVHVGPLEMGTAVVTGFGIGAALATARGRAASARGFGAPETADAKAPLGPAVDVYGMADVLVYAATGVTASELAAKAPDTTPSAFAASRGLELPPTVDDVLVRALAHDPRARPATVGELARALGVAVHGRSGGHRVARPAAEAHAVPPVPTTARLAAPAGAAPAGTAPVTTRGTAPPPPPVTTPREQPAPPITMRGTPPPPPPISTSAPRAMAPPPAPPGSAPAPIAMTPPPSAPAPIAMTPPPSPPAPIAMTPAAEAPPFAMAPTAPFAMAPPYPSSDPAFAGPTSSALPYPAEPTFPAPRRSRAPLVAALAAATVLLLGGIGFAFVRTSSNTSKKSAVAAGSAGSPSSSPSPPARVPEPPPAVPEPAGSARVERGDPPAVALARSESELLVVCTPACDVVLVDKKPLRDHAKPARMKPGTYGVGVSRAGYGGQWKKVVLEGGARKTVTFELVAAPAAARGAAGTGSAAAAKKPCGKFLKRCD